MRCTTTPLALVYMYMYKARNLVRTSGVLDQSVALPGGKCLLMEFSPKGIASMYLDGFSQVNTNSPTANICPYQVHKWFC